MKFTIKHEKKGRIRVHLFQKYMNFTQADTLQYYLENLDGVKKAQVFNRTSDALIYYTGERNELLKAIQAFGYSRVSVPAQVLENSGRELNETYKEKLVNKVIFHYGRKLLLPYPLSAIYTTDRGSGSGCNCNRCFYFPWRLLHSRFCYVPAWNRRIA